MNSEINKYERSIEDVTETLRKAAARGSKCVILIGAGCSKSAGIPLASEFIEIIKREYPRAYRYATPATYANCMAQLSHSERKSLLSKYIDAARLNWSHIAIAQLIQDGAIDRVLTTNFDPLVVRACALIGEYPAVYDAASSQISSAADIHDRSIFYLHGQRTGFKILNTEDEVTQQFENLRPVFDEVGVDRVWIIVGYSGENDPAFEHIARLGVFKNNCYWICFKGDEPPTHVREKLLKTNRGVFFVKGHDSDNFLIRIAQECSKFPPVLFREPAVHLKRIKESTLPFPPLSDGIDEAVMMTEPIDRIIKYAGQQAQKDKRKAAEINSKAGAALAAGNYAEAISLWKTHTKLRNKSLEAIVESAYLRQLSELQSKLLSPTTTEKAEAYDRLETEFANALKVIPKRFSLTNNTGVFYLRKASESSFTKEVRLEAYDLAEKYFNAAIRIKCDSPLVAVNLGNVYQSKGNFLNDASILRESLKCYGRAIDLDADYNRAYFTSGHSALYLSHLVKEPERSQVLHLGEARLLSSEEREPNGALYNLACIYCLLGDFKKAESYLRKCIEAKRAPLTEFILKDPDFHAIASEEWFKILAASANIPVAPSAVPPAEPKS